ncbi:NACHT and WD repeat domain-containing protein, partial [Vibrio sp. YYF0003]|uniref:NACHT and WD repeat domain-containing protein n=1 Tax=Vibrio sp. YYF0003 TaxID=3116646 RepID=UPI002EB83F77|nr:AAA family ATPase [Vibrio sp. YYF0003]
MADDNESGHIKVSVQGGKAQGVIGAHDVKVEHLIINNYHHDEKSSLDTSREKTDKTSLIEATPYKGLANFGPKDAKNFFGREETIHDLKNKVEKQSFLAVLGHSGSGKSSVVLAGLAPKLHESGEWIFSYFRVSDSTQNDPFLALAQALLPMYEPELNSTQRILYRNELAEGLRAQKISISDILDTIKHHHPNRRVLLIADQFEELYTSNIPLAIQHAFIDLLLTASTPNSEKSVNNPLSLVITLRTDFLGIAAAHRPFANAINKSAYLVGAMSQEELRQAIEAPASRLDVQFQEGLVDIILNDVGQEPGNLPLLQFCLSRLWEKQSNKVMSLVDYESIGRVSGALTYHANTIYDQLSANDQIQLSHILKQLVKLSSGTEATRRVAMRDNFSDEHWVMVQKLADESHRLVVVNTASEQEAVEVVHEALITHWDRLKHWVNEDRQFLVWRDDFRVLMTNWTKNGRQNTELLRGNPLSLAESWLNARPESFVDIEREFIEQSIKEQQAQQQKALKQAQAIAKRNTLITFISIAAIIVLGFMGMRLTDELETSEANLKIAQKNESLNLTNMSRELTESGNALLGALLALEALPDTKLDKNRPYLPQAEQALYSALLSPIISSKVLVGQYTEYGGYSGVKSASFSPDGTRIVTVSWDNTAMIWQADTGQALATLLYDDKVWSASFSPDGTRILATSGNTAVIWQADTGQALVTLPHDDGVWSAS